MSLTYEKICDRLGFDLDEYIRSRDEEDENREWIEDDNYDPYPLFNLMTDEEIDFYADYRMKKLGLV